MTSFFFFFEKKWNIIPAPQSEKSSRGKNLLDPYITVNIRW